MLIYVQLVNTNTYIQITFSYFLSRRKASCGSIFVFFFYILSYPY